MTKLNRITIVEAFIIGLTSAYLANAFLCLIVYGEPEFYNQPRSGWYINLVIVIPMLIELIWLLFKKSDAYKSIAE